MPVLWCRSSAVGGGGVGGIVERVEARAKDNKLSSSAEVPVGNRVESSIPKSVVKNSRGLGGNEEAGDSDIR